MLPPLKPIPIKERLSVLYVERCQLDVLDGAFVAIDVAGVRTHIPVGGVACLMLEPGVRISHAACRLAAQAGTLLVWVGEAGVRLYSSGQPGGARADKLLYQARLALDEDARLKVAREMYRHTGKPLSFVYDVADIYKFETVVPVAFAAATKGGPQVEREVRLRCRDVFRRTRLLEQIIPDIENRPCVN